MSTSTHVGNEGDPIVIRSSSSSSSMNTNDISSRGASLFATDTAAVVGHSSSMAGRSQSQEDSPSSPTNSSKKRKLPWSKKKRNKTEKGNKKKKPKKPPQFVVSDEDLFASSESGISFVVRGRPVPQERDRMGWNRTRYNPSKPSQKAFAKVIMDSCSENGLNSMTGSSTHLGDALVVVTASFHFPTRKNGGSIKNTADVDNLVKFLLDSLNGVLYDDDGQVVKIIAEKAFSDTRGGNGYTYVSVEMKES